MKFYEFAMFLFIFQLVSVYFMENSQALGFGLQISFHELTEADFQQAEANFTARSLETTEATSENILDRLVGFVSEAIKASLSTIFTPLKKYVVSMPYILISLGVPPGFAWMISVPLYIIQIVGIMQFATGRSFKDID